VTGSPSLSASGLSVPSQALTYSIGIGALISNGSYAIQRGIAILNIAANIFATIDRGGGTLMNVSADFFQHQQYSVPQIVLVPLDSNIRGYTIVNSTGSVTSILC
jgi:glycerate kinase